MQAVLAVVLPVFSIVLLGYLLAVGGIFTAATSTGLTRFMFYVAVPAMLFKTLAATTLPLAVPWEYLAAFYLPSFCVFILGVALAAKIMGWARNEQGIAAITSSYSNMVMLGLPLTVAAFGDEAILPLFLLLAPQSLLLFTATTFVIEIYGRDRTSGKQAGVGLLLTTFGKLLVNPVILSLSLGIAVNLSEIQINRSLAAMLEMISDAAPACALTALGVGLAQYRLSGQLMASSGLVVLKNFIHPLLVWGACIFFDIATPWMQVAILLAAMPTGINAYIFAQNYQLQSSIVTKTIVISTIISVLTVSGLLHVYLH